jgi:hypothetical protein
MAKDPDDIDGFDSFDDDSMTVSLPEGKTREDDGDDKNRVEVDVVDDTPERDRRAKPLDREVEDPSDEELQSYGTKIQKRIKDLTHARHDERRKWEAAERERVELAAATKRLLSENQRLKEYVKTGEKQFAETSTAAAEAELAEARRKLKEAHDAFDTDAIVAAQESLNDAQIKLRDTKNFKPLALQEPEDEVQTGQSSAQPQLDAKTQAWIDRNKWWSQPGYEEITSFALGLHQKLVNSGVDPRSDTYFERIDARLKSTFPELSRGTGGEDDTRQTDEPRRPSSIVAPVTRSTGKRRVTLTATQVKLCRDLGITPQQYAEQLMLEGEI